MRNKIFFHFCKNTMKSQITVLLFNSNRLPTGIFKSSARKYRKPVCFQNITINISRRFHWCFAVSFFKDTSSGIYALHKKIKLSIKVSPVNVTKSVKIALSNFLMLSIFCYFNFSYWSKFLLDIITGYRVLTIFVYKGFDQKSGNRKFLRLNFGVSCNIFTNWKV